jgi:hypothetical protein
MGETNLKNEIPLAQFIKKVNESFGTTGQINQAIFQASFDLAEKIQSSLRSIETLKLADKQNSNSTTPVGVDKEAYQICPEILAWSISLLSTAWTQWVFASKVTNPNYQTDPEYRNDPCRQAAIVNVKIVVPYIRNSVLDAMDQGNRIGLCKETNYEPSPAKEPAIIKLRKEEDCCS